jgi:hypothetical protein
MNLLIPTAPFKRILVAKGQAIVFVADFLCKRDRTSMHPELHFCVLHQTADRNSSEPPTGSFCLLVL